MTILIIFLTAVHAVIALFIIFLVLMQKSQEQGVGTAFGGGFTDSMLGGSTTPLVKLTVYCAAGMLVTTMALGFLHADRGDDDSIIKPPKTIPGPAVPGPSDATNGSSATVPSEPASTETTVPATPAQPEDETETPPPAQ